MAKSKEIAAATPSKPEKDYDAEHAFDTIVRAEEHKSDKPMMDRVKKHAGRKLKAMKGIHAILGEKEEEPIRSTDQLRKLRNKKALGNMG